MHLYHAAARSDGKDFETEFVEILNQQCHRYLKQKLKKGMGSAWYSDGKDFEAEFLNQQFHRYLKQKLNLSMVTSKKVLKYIGELGIYHDCAVVSLLDMIIQQSEKHALLKDSRESFTNALMLRVASLRNRPCGNSVVLLDAKERI